MNDTPSPPVKKSASLTAFLRGFNVEDLILYIFSLVVLLLFAILFYQHYASTVRAEPEKPLVERAWLQPTGDNICLDFIKAHVTNLTLRYGQARIATATNAVRRSLVLLLGTIGFLLGCIIVIRGVRDVPFDANVTVENKARFRLITSSPGIIVVVLSTILVMGVVLLNDRVEVNDAPLAFPAPCLATPATGSAVTAPAGAPAATPTLTPTPTVKPQFWTPTPTR